MNKESKKLQQYNRDDIIRGLNELKILNKTCLLSETILDMHFGSLDGCSDRQRDNLSKFHKKH